jgi:hypothetical protein
MACQRSGFAPTGGENVFKNNAVFYADGNIVKSIFF